MSCPSAGQLPNQDTADGFADAMPTQCTSLPLKEIVLLTTGLQ